MAANAGMVRAFEEVLGMEVIVSPHHGVMDVIGAALLAHEYMARNGGAYSFLSSSRTILLTVLVFLCPGRPIFWS